MTSTSSLRKLLSVLIDSIDSIEAAAERRPVKTSYPTIDDLFDPRSVAEQFAMLPEVVQAANLGVAAATQLAATLKLPGNTLRDRMFAVSFSWSKAHL